MFYDIILRLNPIALLAQLDRVSGYGPEGQGFESLTARHKKTRLYESTTLFFFMNLLKRIKTDKGFEQGGSIRSMRKKTVRWTVFADVATSEARR